MDGTPTPEKDHAYGGSQIREKREQCFSHTMAITGSKIHLNSMSHLSPLNWSEGPTQSASRC